MNWKPFRRGAIYCSPACGGRCTHAQYLAAHSAAKSCLKRMKSKGWTIRVHENLGWFWSLTKAGGRLAVSGGQIEYRENPAKGFHAMLSDTSPNTCNPEWFDTKRFKDPNKAVEHRLRLAANVSARILQLLEDCR